MLRAEIFPSDKIFACDSSAKLRQAMVYDSVNLKIGFSVNYFRSRRLQPSSTICQIRFQ